MQLCTMCTKHIPFILVTYQHNSANYTFLKHASSESLMLTLIKLHFDKSKILNHHFNSLCI